MSSLSSSSLSLTSYSNVHQNCSSCSNRRTKEESYTNTSHISSSITTSTTQRPVSMQPTLFILFFIQEAFRKQ